MELVKHRRNQLALPACRSDPLQTWSLRQTTGTVTRVGSAFQVTEDITKEVTPLSNTGYTVLSNLCSYSTLRYSSL